jgi:hypothetical protein
MLGLLSDPPALSLFAPHIDDTQGARTRYRGETPDHFLPHQSSNCSCQMLQMLSILLVADAALLGSILLEQNCITKNTFCVPGTLILDPVQQGILGRGSKQDWQYSSKDDSLLSSPFPMCLSFGSASLLFLFLPLLTRQSSILLKRRSVLSYLHSHATPRARSTRTRK